MEFEFNQLVESFAKSDFRVKDVYRYKVEPGRKGRQRTAPFPGILIPISGKAEFRFNGIQYMTDPKKIIHGGAEMLLDKKVIGNKELQYMAILYEVKNEHRNGLRLPDTHFELTIGHSPRLKGLLNRLWKISHIPDTLSEFQRETLFRCVLEEIFVCTEKRFVSHDRDLYERISDYIHEHYSEELSVGDLAEMYELTPNRLYYIFHKYAGMGPGDYLILYRMNRAKELLLTTDAYVHEIAGEVGYSDPLYFSRIFQKRIGCSPSELRKVIKE